MRRFSATGTLLDDGVRLYRRNAPALLRFTFGPSLAITLIMGAAMWYLSTSNTSISSLGVLIAGGLVCFPFLIFLSAGVLHGVAAAATGAPMQARHMAAASLRKLGSTLLIAAITSLLTQIIGIMIAVMLINVVSQVANALRQPIYQIVSWEHSSQLYQTLLAWIGLAEGLSYYTTVVLALQLPSALMLYLIQHNLSRLARPSRFDPAAFLRTLWTPVAAALLSGVLVCNMLLMLGLLLARFLNSTEITILAISIVSLILFWTLAPLQPIWMALLYQRNRGTAHGEDLAERVRAWQARHRLITNQPRTEE